MSNPLSTGADEALFGLAQTLREAGYRFVTVTPASHARVNRRAGNEIARDLADVFGWSRPFDRALLPAALLERMERAGAIAPAGALWRCTVRISTLHGETFVHSAYPTAAADAVFFGPDTYRFADAIAAWLARAERPVRRAVDVCCGAGPGAIVIAKARPDADVLMADINDAALRLARINARLAGAVGATVAKSDLLGGVDGRFDLIVANPPYLLDPARRAYRHGGGALGEGLSLSIVDAALDRLAPGGTLLLYTGSAVVDGTDAFLTAAARRLEGAPVEWSYRELDPDVFGEELEGGAYAHADRIAAVLLTLTKVP